MRMRVLRSAHLSINAGLNFYERQQRELGSRFRTSVLSDIRSLEVTAGVHQLNEKGYHRKICSKFPFSIYYKVEDHEVRVYAVFDDRRDPHWISDRLQ